jgi:hypothetical protein
MTHFLLQQRHLHAIDQGPPSFPSKLTAKIRFGPEDAFGVPSQTSRTTAKRATPAHLLWNANEGISVWQGDIIDALDTKMERGGLTAHWAGNLLDLGINVNSIEEVEQLVGSASQLLPAYLSLRLQVFVWVKEFQVEVGGRSFRLETASHRYGITIATTEHNQTEAIQSVDNWLKQRRESLRAVMAIYYYRQALRLAALEPDRQSMVAEVILNLAKAIEIIFSSDRERLRSKAKEWGLDTDFIERWIIPVLLIRNELDVAHVASAPLLSTQHQAILDFLARASVHVQTLLLQVLEMSQSGRVILDPPSASVDADKERLLKKIEEYAASQ